MPKPPPDRGDLIFSPEHGAAARSGKSGGAKSGGAKQAGGEAAGGRPRGQAGRSAPPGDGVVRVARERRRGKGVTLITGVPLTGSDLDALGKALKQRCGSGGTTKDGVIEIQGDHRDVLLAELQSRGWTVKRVGG